MIARFAFIVFVVLMLGTAAVAQTRPTTSISTDDEQAGDLSQLLPGAGLPSENNLSRVMRFGNDRYAASAIHPSFSPDGKQIVVSMMPKSTVVFETATGQRVAQLPPAVQTEFVANDLLAQTQPHGINIVQKDGTVVRTLSIEFPQRFILSRDGKRIAIFAGYFHRAQTGGNDPSITLWNTQTGDRIADLGPLSQRMRQFPSQIGSYTSQVSRSMDIAADGTLLTVSADGHVRLWDSADGQPKTCADIPIDPFVNVSLAQDGKSIILSDDKPRQIDLASGTVTPLPPMVPPMPLRSFDASTTQPTARPIAGAFPASSPAQIRAHGFPFVRYPYGAIDYSPDGKYLVFLRETEILCWDIANKRELEPMQDVQVSAGADITRDGTLLVVPRPGRLQLFDMTSGKPMVTPCAPESAVTAAIFDDDASDLFASTDDGSLYRFDMATGKAAAWRHVPGSLNRITPLTYSDDKLVTADESGVTQQRDSVTLAPAAPTTRSIASSAPPPSTGLPTSDGLVAVSRDRHLMAVARADKTIRFFSLDDGSEPLEPDLNLSPDRSSSEAAATVLPDEFRLLQLQFTPDSKTLLGLSNVGPVAFDVQNRSARWLTYSKIGYSPLFAVSDDGRLLAFGSSMSSRIDIVDTNDGLTIAHLHDIDGAMSLIKFVPGTTRLLVVDGTIFNVYDWRQAIESATDQSDLAAPANLDAIASLTAIDAYRALFGAMKHPDDLDRQAAALSHLRIKTDVELWIDGLSSTESAERERSHHALERAGSTAASDIRHALARAPAGETHDRLQALSDLIDSSAGPHDATVDPTSQPTEDDDRDAQDRRRGPRIIEALDWLHTDESRAALEQIEQGTNPETALLARIALAHQPRH